MMIHQTRLLVAGAACLTMTATALAVAHAVSAGNGAVHASAAIVGTPASGEPAPVIGFATFNEDSTGVVHVNVKAWNLPSGLHGMHIHAVGACAPTFASAGGHFNPTAAGHGEHGKDEHAEHHAGDLPNLIVNAAGRGHANTASAHFTLSVDATRSLFDSDGSAIVIHANVDDFTAGTTETGPGNSGARIACGVITKS